MTAAPIPSVHYAKSGGFTLAYQVLGDGPRDLVYLPSETPNVVGNWFVPEHTPGSCSALPPSPAS